MYPSPNPIAVNLRKRWEYYKDFINNKKEIYQTFMQGDIMKHRLNIVTSLFSEVPEDTTFFL